MFRLSKRLFKHLLAGLVLAIALIGAKSDAFKSEAFAQTGEPRLALVIGNAQYRAAPLTTPANDAGLVAQTLQAAGFDVTGAADLDQAALRQAFRDFIEKVRGAGPNAVVFVYLAGRGVQYAGDNYFVPVDATIARDTDVPVEALRLADYVQALAGLQLKARIIVLDAARTNGFAQSAQPLAGGLALVDAEPGSLYAFNAAPGTVAPDEQGPYGAYAQAVVEMMHQGYAANEVFAQTRLRVNQLTNGAVVPWDISKIDGQIFFFRREASAPPLQNQTDLSKALNTYPPQEAYSIALERDTIEGYEEFVTAFPNELLVRRIRALLAARREALTWYRALEANTPAAYWTFMRRYPHGPHFYDARRRLGLLTAPLDPPPRFDPYDFVGLAAPPEDEYAIVDRPVLVFVDPGFPPPPPVPVFILPERPVEFVHLPPPPPHEHGVLPIPVPVPLPFSRPAVPRPGTLSQPHVGQQQPPQGQPPEGQGQPPHGHELPRPGQPPAGVQPPGTQPPHPQPEHVAPPHVEPEHGPPSHPQPEHVAPPHPEPEHAAPPHPQPEHAAPPHPQPEHAAPPHPQPEHAAPPHPQPEHAAPPHPQPEHAAPPRKEPPKREQEKKDEK